MENKIISDKWEVKLFERNKNFLLQCYIDNLKVLSQMKSTGRSKQAIHQKYIKVNWNLSSNHSDIAWSSFLAAVFAYVTLLKHAKFFLFRMRKIYVRFLKYMNKSYYQVIYLWWMWVRHSGGEKIEGMGTVVIPYSNILLWEMRVTSKPLISLPDPFHCCQCFHSFPWQASLKVPAMNNSKSL